MGKLNRIGSGDEKTPQKDSKNNVIALPATKLNRMGKQSQKNDPKTSPEPSDALTISDKTRIETLKEYAERDELIGQMFRESRKRGRPSRLSEETTRDLEVLARIGLSYKAMAESIMVDESTLMGWLKKNPEFAARITKARSYGKAALVNSLFGHGVRNWQAHAWLLERMHRSEFALASKLELTGKDSGPITFKVVYEDIKQPNPDLQNTTEVKQQ